MPDSRALRPSLESGVSAPPPSRWGWLLLFDLAFLLLEQLVVLRLGQLLFPSLGQVQLAFLGLLLVGALLWLGLARRLWAALTPLPISPRLRPHRGSRAQVVYRAATRLAFESLWQRVGLVTALSGGLGLYAQRRHQLPAEGVAFLLWAAAFLTPLLDAWRALLYEQAARRWLARLLLTRLSLRLPSLSPVELQHAYLLDTYQGRLLMVGLGMLGVALLLGTVAMGLSLSRFPLVESSRQALRALLFWTPPLAILLLSLGLGGLRYATRPLDRCLAAARRNPDPLALDPTQTSLDEPALRVAERLPGWMVQSKLAAFFIAALLLGGRAIVSWQAPPRLVFLLLAELLLCLVATLYVEWPWQTVQLSALTPPHRRLRRLQPPLSTAGLLLPAAAGPLLWFVLLLVLWRSLAAPALPAPSLLRLGAVLAPILGGALLLGLWLRRLTRPLIRLTSEATALSQGFLRSRAPALTASENGSLTDGGEPLQSALTAMQLTLRERLESGTQAQARLEAEVAERTAELRRRNRELEAALAQLGLAQQSLLQAEKLASIGRLVAGITHEINNPINAVVNTVQPLRESLQELLPSLHRPLLLPELPSLSPLLELREMVGVLHRSSRRTDEIVQALHRYAQGGNDAPREVGLKTLLEQALELVQHPLKVELVFVADYPPELRLRSLGGQLQQVFVNLFDNALQALAARRLAEPELIARLQVVATRSPGEPATIVVSDNGAGIAPTVLSRIFDPFFTTKDAAEGWGLGLSIVHSIVSRHAGQIRVESRLGEGTSFIISLPPSG